MKAVRFKPGEVVPENGIYRAEHKSHGLMHTVTLPAHSLFPCCKECGNAVTYDFVRWVKFKSVLPLCSGILQDFVPPDKGGFPPRNKPGRGKIGQSLIIGPSGDGIIGPSEKK